MKLTDFFYDNPYKLYRLAFLKMDVLSLHHNIISDYKEYVSSLINISNLNIRNVLIDRELVWFRKIICKSPKLKSEVNMPIQRKRFNGKKKQLKAHIGYGSSTDPRYSIRFAFFFDDERKKMLLNKTQHQPTKET